MDSNEGPSKRQKLNRVITRLPGKDVWDVISDRVLDDLGLDGRSGVDSHRQRNLRLVYGDGAAPSHLFEKASDAGRPHLRLTIAR